MKKSASNDIGKRFLAFLLVMASYAMAVTTCVVMRPTDDKLLSLYIGGGIAVLLADAAIAFLPQITDWYYDTIMPVFFHTPRGVNPRRWYAKLTPYYLLILMVILIAALFILAVV